MLPVGDGEVGDFQLALDDGRVEASFRLGAYPAHDGMSLRSCYREIRRAGREGLIEGGERVRRGVFQQSSLR
jgi:hypothetical protein